MQNIVCALMKTVVNIYSCEKIPRYLIPCQKSKVKIGSETGVFVLPVCSFHSLHPKNCIMGEKTVPPSVPRASYNFLTHGILYSASSQGCYWHSG